MECSPIRAAAPPPPATGGAPAASDGFGDVLSRQLPGEAGGTAPTTGHAPAAGSAPALPALASAPGGPSLPPTGVGNALPTPVGTALPRPTAAVPSQLPVAPEGAARVATDADPVPDPAVPALPVSAPDVAAATSAPLLPGAGPASLAVPAAAQALPVPEEPTPATPGEVATPVSDLPVSDAPERDAPTLAAVPEEAPATPPAPAEAAQPPATALMPPPTQAPAPSRPVLAATSPREALPEASRDASGPSGGDARAEVVPDSAIPAAVPPPASRPAVETSAVPPRIETSALRSLEERAAPMLAETARPPPVDSIGAAAPAASPAPPAPPPPVRQVTPIAIALAFVPGPQAGFTLALEPAELGRVEIRMRRDGEGHVLHIVAERPETLGLLQRDRQELNASLAQAGLRLDGQGLTFGLESEAREGGQGPNQGDGQQGTPHRARTGVLETPPPMQRHGLLDLNI